VPHHHIAVTRAFRNEWDKSSLGDFINILKFLGYSEVKVRHGIRVSHIQSGGTSEFIWSGYTSPDGGMLFVIS
jgi:hypothetical protein